MSETIKIQNKRASLITLPSIPHTNPKKPSWPMKKLSPGINIVSGEYFETLCGEKGDKHEGVAALFDPKHGVLDIVEEGEPLIPDNASLTLRDMNVEAATSMIEACADASQLNTWLHADDRKGVHKAIAARLEAVEKAAKEAVGGVE